MPSHALQWRRHGSAVVGAVLAWHALLVMHAGYAWHHAQVAPSSASSISKTDERATTLTRWTLVGALPPESSEPRQAIDARNSPELMASKRQARMEQAAPSPLVHGETPKRPETRKLGETPATLSTHGRADTAHPPQALQSNTEPATLSVASRFDANDDGDGVSISADPALLATLPRYRVLAPPTQTLTYRVTRRVATREGILQADAGLATDPAPSDASNATPLAQRGERSGHGSIAWHFDPASGSYQATMQWRFEPSFTDDRLPQQVGRLEAHDRATGERELSATQRSRQHDEPTLAWTSQGHVHVDHGFNPQRSAAMRQQRTTHEVRFEGDVARFAHAQAPEQALAADAQDRLSWLLQLAGIAAANPDLRQRGAVIQLQVVGARGDARVWQLRCVGPTPDGLLRYERAATQAWDTHVDVWLDPSRQHVPARVRLQQRGSRWQTTWQVIGPIEAPLTVKSNNPRDVQ